MTRSKKVLHLDPHASKCIPLLILSRDHGTVSYHWDKKGPVSWEPLSATYNTCVLYVKLCGIYKCTVGGEEYVFEVKGK